MSALPDYARAELLGAMTPQSIERCERNLTAAVSTYDAVLRNLDRMAASPPDFGPMPALTTDELQSGALLVQFHDPRQREEALRRAGEWSRRP